MIAYFLNNSIFKHVQYRSDYCMIVYLQCFNKSGMHKEVNRTMLRGTARIGLKVLFPTQGPHVAYPHSTSTDATDHAFAIVSWDSEHTFI
jgi:hypothetical protein